MSMINQCPRCKWIDESNEKVICVKCSNPFWSVELKKVAAVTDGSYKQVKKKEKQQSIENRLKKYKDEVRRLEAGIDRVMYWFDTEDLSDESVLADIRNNLIALYNGKEIK